MNTTSGVAAAHPAVRAYAAKNGIEPDAFRSDGRVTLTFDDEYAVQLRPASDGRIALASPLLPLAAMNAGKADEVLVQLAETAMGLMQEHASGLCLDEREQALLLQQLLPPGLPLARLEVELADFVNVLALMRRIVARTIGQAPK